MHQRIILPSGRVVVADLLPNSDKQKKALLSFVNDYKNILKKVTILADMHGMQ
jgi:methylglyoxal synthase